jgi:hypothetical protein
MNFHCTSETFLSTPLLISPDLQDGLSLYFWDIHINTTTDLIWSTIWTVFVLLRHFYQHTTDLTWSTRWTVFVPLRHSYQPHYWSHLIYKMDCLCTSETFLSTPLPISPDLQDELVLYFWDIAINTTLDLTWSTRWTGFVLLRHSYQHHYWSHLIYKMNCLSTSETLLSTPLLISPDRQDRLSLYFWDISIKTTTDLTWSTRWTGFVLLRHCYQDHYWSELIYKMNWLCTSETLLSTPLLMSPNQEDELSLYFWDIPINTTTHLTWSTRWTVFFLLRNSYQHHYWSHLIYTMNCLCSSETFLSTPLLISSDLDGRSVFFWDIPINTTTDFTWSTRWTVFVLLRHCYQHHYWSHLIYKTDCLFTFETFLSTPIQISPDLQDRLSLHFWDIPINTTADLTWSTRWIFIVLLRHSYQHHYLSHLINNMDGLCTSETFISTPLLISPDLQYGRSLYFLDISINTLLISPDLQDELSLFLWDISINPTTDLTWSTRWTVFVLLGYSYQHHYRSHLIYKMNWFCTSETLLSTPLLISPDLKDELALYFWDIPINTTTDLTWSTRWTGFVLLRHSYQHHYWSHLIYKMNCLSTSETYRI